MNSRKKVLVLGATGSIGSSCLDIIRHNPDLFEVAGLSAHSDSLGLEKLILEFKADTAILSGKDGEEALIRMILESRADIVVNGISGASGLKPSITALESGKDLALANKETIVMAGTLVRTLADTYQKKIIPVDSEHSAVFNLINAYGKKSVDEIILTASGGPFRTWDTKQLELITPEDALKHPTWSMGPKITIDSASLANKGLEVIEACRLFDFRPDKVKVVVHPQSLVHSFIRTTDGVLYAQISKPDMRHPILSALTWPRYIDNHLDALTFDQLCTMQFEPPRYADFPLLGLAFEAARLEGCYTIAYNAANEIAVGSFIEGAISFPGLSEVTAAVLALDWSEEPKNFEDVFIADGLARKAALEAIKRMKA